MSDTVIRVEGLGKKYILNNQKNNQEYVALRDLMTNGVKGVVKHLQRLKSDDDNFQAKDFWALKDVSFEVRRGDRVGIIGHNGAGKSTLLKILSRITEPTEGRISVGGRVASLLEVGTGFHQELTGRENVFLNGAVLGMSKAEIQQKFDEIVAFSEVEKFLDTPVKHYSSGMKVRLAFAVAAHLEPEILVVDEVLAVGDVKFQKKCLGKLEDVGKEGRTVLFVSHNLGVLQNLCNRGILLKQGNVVADDTSDGAVGAYLKTLEDGAFSNSLLKRTDRRGKGEIRLTLISYSAGEGNVSNILATGYPARFVFHLSGSAPRLSCHFTLYDQHGQAVAHFNSAARGYEDSSDPEVKDQIVCEIDELLLVPGRYRMNIAIMTNKELQDHVEAAALIDVEVGTLRGRPVERSRGFGSVCIPHRWSLIA